MSYLKIENLTVKYINKKEEITAIDNISFEITQNDFLVIVGSSGSGKTTLIKTILGLIDYQCGNIYFNGINADFLTIQERNLAYVSQNYSLYPRMTVQDNIASPLKAQKVSVDEIQKRVLEVSQRLGLMHLLTRKPKQLSGGQQQRVAIARSIIKRPDLFLFDEPFSNLENESRVNFRNEVKLIHEQLRIPFIFSTHDQDEAMILATKIIVMDEGKIIQIGTPEDIYNNPINSFVKDYFRNNKKIGSIL